MIKLHAIAGPSFSTSVAFVGNNGGYNTEESAGGGPRREKLQLTKCQVTERYERDIVILDYSLVIYSCYL